MVVAQEQIIEIVRKNGPLLPAKLAKAIGTNILIASAHLSNLVDEKKVKISNTKVGGSPVYYLDGQQSRLQEFASNLNEKDHKTFDLLRKEKILRDDKQDQLTRFSLRNIKDFAVPLQVIQGNNKIMFWKWYIISNQEAEELIKKVLEGRKVEEQRQRDVEKQKAEEKRAKEEELRRQKEKELTEKRKAEETSRIEQEKKRLEHLKLENEQERVHEKRILEERKKLEEERRLVQKEKEQLQKQIQLERQSLLREIEEKKKEVKKEEPTKKAEDSFLDMLAHYLGEKKIEIINYEIIRKKAEIDLILKVPSVVGDLEYYCKAKNKKSVNDGDLSAAVVRGQLKKLPVLFLTTGDLTKKAKELLDTELKRGILIKKIQ